MSKVWAPTRAARLDDICSVSLVQRRVSLSIVRLSVLSTRPKKPLVYTEILYVDEDRHRRIGSGKGNLSERIQNSPISAISRRRILRDFRIMGAMLQYVVSESQQ